MKRSQIAIIVGAVGIVAIVSVLLVSYETSSVIEVEDVFDKEIKPIEIPEIQEKLDEIERQTNETNYKPLPRDWQTSGPFQIDRSEYAIGEKIFIRIGGLGFDEKGQVAVLRPLNATHYSVYLTIPFDGTQKSGFNYYLEPQLSKTRGLCTIDDIMGKWTLVFRGTNYTNLNFEITEKIIPGTNTDTVC